MDAPLVPFTIRLSGNTNICEHFPKIDFLNQPLGCFFLVQLCRSHRKGLGFCRLEMTKTETDGRLSDPRPNSHDTASPLELPLHRHHTHLPRPGGELYISYVEGPGDRGLKALP